MEEGGKKIKSNGKKGRTLPNGPKVGSAEKKNQRKIQGGGARGLGGKNAVGTDAKKSLPAGGKRGEAQK